MSVALLKWPGGKRIMVPEILRRLPRKINTYYEPMVGGGAVFFAVAAEHRFQKAHINDVNQLLVTTYKTVRDSVDDVILQVAKLAKRHLSMKHPEEYYYQLRNVDVQARNPVLIAAWMLYMNKACFNGLYRVNKSGKFNTPYGKPAKSRIEGLLDPTDIRIASDLLQGVKITCTDFEAAIKHAGKKDAVYFDPPYWPITKSSFVAYASGGFTKTDQKRLALVAKNLRDSGVHVVLSNSDVAKVRKLYESMQIDQIYVPRRIAAAAAGREAVADVIIVAKP